MLESVNGVPALRHIFVGYLSIGMVFSFHNAITSMAYRSQIHIDNACTVLVQVLATYVPVCKPVAL